MRRYLYILLATILMMGCADDTLTVEQDEYVDVTFSAYASDIFVDGSITRSGDDDGDDDLSGYDVRYVIEAWSKDETPILYYRGVTCVDDLTKTLDHTIRIIEGTYDLLFWADYVESGKTDDNHYDTSDGLMSVTIKESNYKASDLSRDCFATRVEDLVVSGSFDLGKVELARPMAMLVVKNYDAGSVQSNDISIKFDRSIPNGYNVLSGEVITDENTTISPSYGTTTAEDDELAFDYIFISETTTYDVTITVGSNTRVSSSTPFKVNMKTNIISNFY